MKTRFNGLLLFGLTLLAFAPAEAAEIPDGTEVKVRLLETVSSLTKQVEDTVHFEAAEDVIVDGATVIVKGARGRGTVTGVEKAKSFGRRGRLDFAVDVIEAVDGSDVPLRPSRELRGAEPSLTLGYPTPFTATLGFFVKGGDVVVTAGTEYTLFVDDPRTDAADEAGG